jgi:protein-disulfide isomerase
MTMRIRWVSAAALGATLLALMTPAHAQTAPAAASAAAAPGAGPPGVAATVGPDTISVADLEQSVALELARLDQQRHSLLERKLNQLIGDRLLAQEAARRGVGVEKLVKEEIDDKTPAVTQAEVNTFIAQNRARLPKGDEAELRPRVAQFLEQQREGQQREAFIASLRAGSPVRVYLKDPEPVRVKVDPKVGYALGSPHAPVTIVEFSDFQCPFCRGVVPTLKQLLARYPDRVRVVFRDFPIPSLHPDAPLAHEAARCAGEQGQFWPYHDLLFERTNMNATALKQYAADLKLDEAKFAECLDSGRTRAAVGADVEEGSRLGVTGTPTFFINGTPLVGNVPLADFQRAIERELARIASTK